MKRLRRFVLGLASALLLADANAQIVYQGTWIQGTISEIQVLSEGSSGLNEVLVFGTFQTGCAVNAFVLTSTDAYFNQAYAAMLAAQAKGVQVKLLMVYCTTNGPARGNGYSVLSN